MPRIHRDSIEHVTSTREVDRSSWRRFRRGAANRVAAVLAGATLLAASYANADGKTAFLAEQLRKNQSFSVRIDAALFHQFNARLRAQLNVENVLNRRYYSTAQSNNNLSPGSPRAIRASLITTF